MTSQQKLKDDFLSFFKRTGSSERYITAWQFHGEYGIETEHVKELLLRWAAEDRLITLEAWDGTRFRPWREWDPPGAVFSSSAAADQVRVRLLADGAEYVERISKRPPGRETKTDHPKQPVESNYDGASAMGEKNMYNQDLGDKVLERIHKSFPELATLEQLRAEIPEYASLPDEDWFSMYEALAQYELVEGPAVRSGAANKVGALYGIKLTKLGKARMDELMRLLELGGLKFNQAVKGLYDDIATTDGLRTLLGEKFGGWHLVPSQAIPQEVMRAFIGRFARIKSAFEDSYIHLFENAEGGVTARRARWLNRKAALLLGEQKIRGSHLLNGLLSAFGVPPSIASAPLDELQIRCEEIANALSASIKIAELSRGLKGTDSAAPAGDVSEARRQQAEKRTQGISVLISHSSRDRALAEALIDLLRSALGLSADQIRCTSVDGYRLPAGVNTADQLRGEITSATVLIGVLTPNSLSSTYVLFELGARWGAGLFMIPLLAGVKPEEMRGPHSALNALSCETEAQLLQLVQDAGRELGIAPQSAASYLRYASAVRALSESIAAPPPHTELQKPSAKTKRDFTMSVKAEGTPPSQILKLMANQPISASRLEYMLSDQTCIVAEDLSLDGETIEVPLSHESLTRLFNIPRPDMSQWDHSGPVKFGLTVSTSGQTQQYILSARMENSAYGSNIYRNVIGSAQFHGIG